MNADQIAHNAEFFSRKGMDSAVDSVLETFTDVYGEAFMTREREQAFDAILLALQRWESTTGVRFDASEVADVLAPLLKDYDHPCTPEWSDEHASP